MQESIECGDGNDLAVTDEFDSALNCETVQASRELMPDVDNDGVAAPLDCDDRNASRRPGLPDKPGNRVDENCDGADTPFARVVTPVQSVFSTSGGRTRVLRLRVLDIPAGAVIQLRCKGGKKRNCFKGTKRFRIKRGAASKDIRGPVKGRSLKAKARLEVRVLAPDSIAKVVRYSMRQGNRLPVDEAALHAPWRKASAASADASASAQQSRALPPGRWHMKSTSGSAPPDRMRKRSTRPTCPGRVKLSCTRAPGAERAVAEEAVQVDRLPARLHAPADVADRAAAARAAHPDPRAAREALGA